jgi:hypothetical protein
MEPLIMFSEEIYGCEGWRRMKQRRLSRRGCLEVAGALASVSWWTLLAERLASQEKSRHAKSIILLWMQGGPSQLETFDPHPNTRIGGEVHAIPTSVPGLEIANTLPLVAQQMHRATLIRSMVSKEGDHERATYHLKSGWRPDPTLVHPGIGAVLCHQTQDSVEIPRHVSILSSEWPAKGGYLGSGYDAFMTGDPRDPLPNLKSYEPEDRLRRRLEGLSVVERQFARGRLQDLDHQRTLHQTSTRRAIRMMDSQQIAAFDVMQEPASVLESFGDTPFGRGCLAAVRLVETGVRCVEVELSGWDTHINNHALQSRQCKILDAALAGLLQELDRRELLDQTIVLCTGEFGRTPTINPAGGRDHWPTGFSTLVAGGPFRPGHVHGRTSQDPATESERRIQNVEQPVAVEDLHATLLTALGINPSIELMTPIGRPMQLSKGKVVRELING